MSAFRDRGTLSAMPSVNFIEGRLYFTPVQLGHQDPPGETHLSSYMGDE